MRNRIGYRTRWRGAGDRVYPAGMAQHRTAFHSTAIWQRTRRVAKIEANHTCVRCKAFLPGKGELHVHHRKPVARSMALALEPANFQVVCPECHNTIEPRTGSGRIKSGCNEAGQPTDPRHPWNVNPGGAG